MQFLAFLLVYPFLWLLSVLPFRVLYFFSDMVYILVYHIIGYRKKTVRENLSIALKHLSEKERLEIEKKFYHHFVDSFVEMIKTMNISEKEIERRFKFTNLHVYQNMEKKGKSIALMCGHYGSYEWLISMNRHISFQGYAIYKKIANPYFDNLVRKIRLRFKAYLIDTKSTIAKVHENNQKNILSVYGFASDQSPKASSAYHFNEFFGVKVPIHTGAEMLAKRMDLNVIFVAVKKVKRGFYEATFHEIVENPQEIPNYEISDQFMKMIEQQILEKPEHYLWTHKRFKYRQ